MMADGIDNATRIIQTRRMTQLSVLVAIAVGLHVVESFLPGPVLPVPGAKLGLANLITLVALYLYGFRAGLTVSFLRCVIGSLVGGTFMTITFFLSFTGGMVSALLMGLALHIFRRSISLVGVSVTGATAHNLAQLAMAILITRQPGLVFYLPYMLLFALPTGIFVGLVGTQLGRHWLTLKVKVASFGSPISISSGK